jgi:hypothetical protein
LAFLAIGQNLEAARASGVNPTRFSRSLLPVLRGFLKTGSLYFDQVVLAHGNLRELIVSIFVAGGRAVQPGVVGDIGADAYRSGWIGDGSHPSILGSLFLALL